jgi:hypothetical protein
MAYEVKVTADKVVLVFNTETSLSVPVLRQESYPNGASWTKKQAQAWADAYEKFLEDPTNPMPGHSPENPVFEFTEPTYVDLDNENLETSAEK